MVFRVGTVLVVWLRARRNLCWGCARQAVNPRTTGWIVAVQGQVSLLPSGKLKHAIAAQLCMEFRRGDLLKVTKGGQATIVCADLQKYPLPPGIHGLPCRSGGKNVLDYHGSQVVSTRSNIDDLGFPQILAPRRTKLLDAQPTLRWTPVAGASTYNVSLAHKGQVIWDTTVNGATEMIYPATAPKLATGETYKLVVAAGKRSSEEEGLPGLGFTLLGPEQAQMVRNSEARIRGYGLPDAPTHFLISQLYAASGLNTEAIERLKELPIATTEPAVAQRLGDFYREAGLNRQAEEQYLLALELTRLAHDLLGQARVQAALGQIYEAFGNKNEAARYWRLARELYQQLGDFRMASQIQAALTKLSE